MSEIRSAPCAEQPAGRAPKRTFLPICAAIALILSVEPTRAFERSDIGMVCPGDGQRVALLVGNSIYNPGAPEAVAVGEDSQLPLTDLKGPIADTYEFGSLLCQYGFQVFRYLDLTKKQFNDVLDEFVEISSKSDLALFHYSGHGTQIADSNYLIPVGAVLTNKMLKNPSRNELDSIEYELIDLQEDISRALKDVRRQVIIIDACRTLLYGKAFKGTGSEEGFRQIIGKMSASGRYILFAADDGEAAQDVYMDTGHSPLMHFLLDHLKKNPERDWRPLFEDVAIAVAENVGSQTPVAQSWVFPATCLKTPCGDSEALFQPDLAAGIRAMNEEKFETAEKHLGQLAEAGDAAAQLALASLYWKQSRPADDVLQLILDAAEAGNREAERVLISLALRPDYGPELLADEEASSGLWAAMMSAESARDRAIDLADQGDAFALLLLHTVDQPAESDADADTGPVEEETPWLRSGAELGYPEFLLRTALIGLGRPVDGLGDRYTSGQRLRQRGGELAPEAIGLAVQAARAGSEAAILLLIEARLDSGAALPGIADDDLRALGESISFDEEVQEPDLLLLDLASRHLYADWHYNRSVSLAALAEMQVTGIGEAIDLEGARGSLLQLSEGQDYAISDAAYYSLWAEIFRLEGQGRQRFDALSHIVDSYSKAEDWREWLSLGNSLTWDATSLESALEAIDGFEWTDIDEFRGVVSEVISTDQPILIARLYEKLLINYRQRENAHRGDLAFSLGQLAELMMANPDDYPDTGANEYDVVEFYRASARGGLADAVSWLRERGLPVPELEANRVDGPRHNNWQFVKYQRDTGQTCFTVSIAALRKTEEEAQDGARLYLATSTEHPSPGNFYYFTGVKVDGNAGVRAVWEGGHTTEGSVRTGETEGKTITFLGDPLALIELMKRSRVVTVQYHSARGEAMEDIYSLVGFRAAYDDLVSGCPDAISPHEEASDSNGSAAADFVHILGGWAE